MIKIFIKLLLIIKFLFIFVYEIFLANFRVAHDVMTPGFRAKPGVIAISLDCERDIEITLLAIIISLTPGTLALDISADKKIMYIHAMFIIDKEKLINDLKMKFEKPLIRILR